MANHPSAEKRNRQRLKRTDRNRGIRRAVRTKVKEARAALAPATGAAGIDPSAAKTAIIDATRALDKAASKGVVHPKAASRRAGRLARAMHKATAPAK